VLREVFRKVESLLTDFEQSFTSPLARSVSPCSQNSGLYSVSRAKAEVIGDIVEKKIAKLILF